MKSLSFSCILAIVNLENYLQNRLSGIEFAKTIMAISILFNFMNKILLILSQKR